jgi:hypothetical protein
MNLPEPPHGRSVSDDRINDGIEVSNVAAFLKDLLTEEFDYLPNPGNAGDALMAKATFDLFEHLNLQYRSIENDRFGDPDNLSRRTLVLSGGGNFSEGGYNSYATLLARVHHHARRVIVLPHTISGNANLLAQFGSNVVLFCRERVSYEHVRRHAVRANVLLAHDMAFLLDVKSALSFKPCYVSGPISRAFYGAIGSSQFRSYPGFADYWHGFRSRMPILSKELPRRGVGDFFRTDIEKTDINLPEGNVDASLAFNFGVTSPIKSGFTVFHLFHFLDKFDAINTNRLHLAIAGALLGKKVHLSSNSYYKCRAVFEHSLRERYPNVLWADE